MCPQGHPHQLEPILLKHFPIVLKVKAKAKRKALKKLHCENTRTQNLNKGWRGETMLCCLFCELIFKDILLLTLYDVHYTYSNSIQTTQPNPPHPHPHTTLIEYRGKGWTNKIILPGPMQYSFLVFSLICNTSIHDSGTIGCRLDWNLDC